MKATVIGRTHFRPTFGGFRHRLTAKMTPARLAFQPMALLRCSLCYA